MAKGFKSPSIAARERMRKFVKWGEEVMRRAGLMDVPSWRRHHDGERLVLGSVRTEVEGVLRSVAQAAEKALEVLNADTETKGAA